MRYEIYAAVNEKIKLKPRYFKTLSGAKRGLSRFISRYPECTHFGIWDNCKDERVLGIHGYEA